jgi:hypothetical protein
VRDHDAFEGEPGTGGGYDKVIEAEFTIGDGVARRIVTRLRGRPRTGRVSVVLEEVRGGEYGVLVRYDDAHRRFHRHAAGWPEPDERVAEFLDGIAPEARAAYAMREIRARYTEWEADVFRSRGEELR